MTLADRARAPRVDWTDAACRHLDPELFFPERGVSTAHARAACASCPLREPCLEFALAHHMNHGIWGGLTEQERRRIRRQRRRGS